MIPLYKFHPKAHSFFLTILFFSAFTLPVFAREGNGLHTLVRQIETKRYSWHGFQSSIEISFSSPQGQNAWCQGKMTYFRLSEQMLIECFDRNTAPAFMFALDDMAFEIYLPGRAELYRGNIFDLENSRDFNSHLRPFDLYRAIKPIPIPESRASLEAEEDGLWSIWIHHRAAENRHPERRVISSPQGDVFSEIFFTKEGTPYLGVYRKDFHEYPASEEHPSVIFPRQILIENYRDESATEISISGIRFFPPSKSAGWTLNYPPDTKVINVVS